VALEDSGKVRLGMDDFSQKVLARSGLSHDDPYGVGWLMVVAANNRKPDLKNLVSGEGNGP